MKMINPIFIRTSTILIILIFICGLAGIFTPDIYENETFDRQVYLVWQDYLSIFLILPVVFVSGYLASTGREAAQFIWAGSLLYVLRTYTVFSYNAEFSILFFVYCLILSISFYSLNIRKFIIARTAIMLVIHKPDRIFCT